MKMNKFKLTILICFILFSNSIVSQAKDNLVRDTTLSSKLRKYLIEHIDVFTLDSLGKKQPLNQKWIQEEYGDAMIVSVNLKTDSVITNKKLIGIYACRFACFHGCSPHLYIQYPNKIEFIDIDKEDFNLDKLLQKTTKFFNKYPNQFTLQEKVKTIQGMMETIYNNKW